MIGTDLGGYRLERELGSGGMGTVYLARVTDPAHPLGADTEVAVKIVHRELLDRPGVLGRFAREVEAGSRVDHPNVVRTLDAGEVEVDGEATHYLVLEYVPGRNLRTLLDELGKVPEALLREIARQTAAGLTAIHEAGYVHRDLKPENVLLADDHTVRIMDLGVAHLMDATTILTGEGQFAGSVYYAAPEQFESKETTSAADLYTLGILLYELATGANPFRHDEIQAVIGAHMTHTPPAITEQNPEISPFLSEVTAKLLAKNPSHRFPSADEVCNLLTEGEASSFWADLERTRFSGFVAPPTVPVRRDTRIYGREAHLELLTERWEKAKEGLGGVVLIQGEAGIGKTRFVDAFLGQVGGEDAHLLYGSYPPSRGLGGLSEALLTHFGSADLAEALAPYLTVVPRLVPGFAALLRHEAAPEGCESVGSDAFLAVFCHLLRGLAEEKPVVWVVDDLHFANRDSRDIVLSLARVAANHRVLLVLTTRPGIPEEELVHFGRIEGSERLELSRLSPREVIEVLRDAFRSEALADRVGAKIAYKSDGVPFFVFELIRGLREGRFIEEAPDGTFVATRVIDDIEVPSAVRDIVAARFVDLTEEERALLDVGAVQGYRFRGDLIAGVRGMPRLVVLERLASVERRTGVIHSGRDGFTFDHHQVQEILYESVPPELRAEYHSAIAEALEEASPAPSDAPGEVALDLADHHLKGSRPHAALPWILPALEHLGKSWRNEAAISLAERSLSVADLLPDRERAEVLSLMAARLQVVGRADEQREALTEVLALADGLDDPGLEARARIDLGAHFASNAVYDRAEAMLQEGIAIATMTGEREQEGKAEVQLGNVYWAQERFDPARDHYRRALAIAREREDPAAAAHALGSLAVTALGERRNEEALERFMEAVEIAAGHGERRLEAWLEGNIGSACWNLGRIDEARARYERSLELARDIGDRNIEGSAVGNLGRVYAHIGRSADAFAQLSQRIAMARETGAVRGEAIALVNYGALRAQVGDLSGAEDSLRTARAQLESLRVPSMIAFALLGLGDVASHRGDEEECLRLYGEALEIRTEAGDLGGAAMTGVAIECVRLRRGETEGARERLEPLVSSAREAQAHNAVLKGTLALAGLPGGDASAAARAFEERRPHLDTNTELEALWLLYRAGGDPAVLSKAHQLLLYLRDQAPEDCREAILTNIPMHREILAAWTEAFGSGETTC